MKSARWNAGMDRPCPRCEADPDEPCRNVHTRIERATTHEERKPKERK